MLFQQCREFLESVITIVPEPRFAPLSKRATPKGTLLEGICSKKKAAGSFL
jgi:hypothetical protein